MSNCIVCRGTTGKVRSVRILGKHNAELLQCQQCNHVQLAEPHWLEDAYTNAIAATDTGLVARNLTLAEHSHRVLHTMVNPNGKYVDFSGGTGLFVRLMRDRGMDFRWTDPYCENIHALGFEYDHEVPEALDAVTAFEVIEHMPDPDELIDFVTRHCPQRTLLFTTELHSGDVPNNDWWYYAFDLGQHISFFCEKSLRALAERHGLQFVSHRGLHMFSAQSINARKFERCVRHWTRRFRRIGRLKVSLTQSDHDQMLERVREKQ